MPKKKHQYRLTIPHIAIALMIGVVAMPVTLTALFQSVDDDGKLIEQIDDQRPRALMDRVNLRLRRRQFRDAQNVYQDLLRKGVDADDLIPPDVNNQKSVLWYFQEENIRQFDDALHGSAHKVMLDAKEIKDIRYADLLEADRDTIDGYVATGFCPLSIKTTHKHIVGFYDLCLAKLKEQSNLNRETFYERSSYLRGWSQGRTSMFQSLKKRLQLLDESLGATRLRPKHTGRPSTRSIVVPTTEE